MNATFEYWERKVLECPEPPIVEAGFLRAYICFEEFIADSFVAFALGAGHDDYVPERELQFASKDQLLEIIRGESQFVDYFRAIERCSKHIFRRNPFSVVFSDADFSEPLGKMKLIRNHLAHRSADSRERYISKVLRAYNMPETLEPGEYLLRKRKQRNETFYSYYIDTIKQAHSALTNAEILKVI